MNSCPTLSKDFEVSLLHPASISVINFLNAHDVVGRKSIPLRGLARLATTWQWRETRRRPVFLSHSTTIIVSGHVFLHESIPRHLKYRSPYTASLRICKMVLTLSSEDSYVTRINAQSCDLRGFASAGFATWTDEHFDLYDAQRAFDDPDTGLSDTVYFGRARYEWEGQSFIIYTTRFTEYMMRGPQQVLFILAPCANKVVDSHHTGIDALLLACGRWTKELHEEIFVFDQGRWSKSRALFKSVESSSWDDIVLLPGTKSKLIEDIQGFFENQDLYKSFAVPWKRGISKYSSCLLSASVPMMQRLSFHVNADHLLQSFMVSLVMERPYPSRH